MYVAGLSSCVCLLVSAVVSVLLVLRVYRMSKKYGEHGLMKASARRGVPGELVSRSRMLLCALKKDI
jgi:hypothetical protein